MKKRIIRGLRVMSAVMSAVAVLTIEKSSLNGFLMSMAMLVMYLGFTMLEESLEVGNE